MRKDERELRERIEQTRLNAEDIAAAFDATIIYYGDEPGGVEILIQAPKNKTWNSGDVHEMVISVKRGVGESFKLRAWNEAVARMEMGTEDCSDGEECEWCNPTDDAQRAFGPHHAKFNRNF